MRARVTVSLMAVAAAIGAVVMLAACSGGSTPGAGSTEASAPPPSGSAVSGPAAGGRVAIKDFSFLPANLEVKAGETVRWENQDPTSHKVVGDDGSFASPSMQQGASFSFTFSAAGTFRYHCAIHPSMVGQVVVK